MDNTKKGQLWYGDFSIGILIMIIISVVFYMVLFDIGNTNTEINKLQFGVENVANYLMSEGYGSWVTGGTNSDGKLGIVKDNKIDENLLYRFRNLNYDFTKKMFGLTDLDYTVYLKYKDGSEEKLADFLEDDDQINAKNIITFDRIVYYNKTSDSKNGEIVKLRVVVYE